jgi:predicted CoA-substrate-specific enzyme activase
MRRNGMLFAGIDVGSLSTDAVIIDQEGTIRGSSVVLTGASSKKAARKAFDEALAMADASPEDIQFIVSTGYGREIVPFAHHQVTEITCHGKGAHALFPETRTIIDIGGQDSKAIRIGKNGKVMDFAMNDKCAAGTGRFLEVMARTLELDLEDMGPRSLQAKNSVSISSMCTVFAESEVVSRIADGNAIEDIIRGIHNSIADRVIALMKRVGVQEQVTMTGGVAKNVGVVAALSSKLDTKLNIAEEPQIVGALGAALLALEQSQKEE